MADPLAILAEFERRSRQNAFGLPQQDEQSLTWDGLAFRLAERRFVAPMGQVLEILPVPPLTRVPNVRSWLEGIANVRGRLVPVVDLHGFITGSGEIPGPATRVLITEYHGMTVALRVPEVIGMRHFTTDSRIAGDGGDAGLGEGYVTECFVQDEQRWPVFDLHAVLKNPQFTQVAA